MTDTTAMAKKEYQRPTLAVLGDVRALTLNSGRTTTAKTDGGTTPAMNPKDKTT